MTMNKKTTRDGKRTTGTHRSIALRIKRSRTNGHIEEVSDHDKTITKKKYDEKGYEQKQPKKIAKKRTP